VGGGGWWSLLKLLSFACFFFLFFSALSEHSLFNCHFLNLNFKKFPLDGTQNELREIQNTK
jgi:hypothetical protein